MQSKTFSQLSFLLALIVTGFVLISLAERGASEIPPPEFPAAATSTALQIAAYPPLSELGLATTTVQAPRGALQAFIASSSEDRQRGLSGQAELSADAGMLFVFDAAGDHSFWMKDTLIPLDFVWISSDKKVLGVTPRVSTSTYPDVFYPPAPILYFLELNSGGAEQWGIATGTQLVF